MMKILISLKSGETVTSNIISDDKPSGDHHNRKLGKVELLCKKISKLDDVDSCRVIDKQESKGEQ